MFCQFGKERVGDIGNDEADHVRAAAAQTARDAVRPEIQLANGGFHQFAQFLADGLVLRQNA